MAQEALEEPEAQEVLDQLEQQVQQVSLLIRVNHSTVVALWTADQQLEQSIQFHLIRLGSPLVNIALQCRIFA